MKQIFLLHLFSACFTIHAQRTNQVIIGFNFSPDYSYRTLKPGDPNAPGNVVIDLRNETEKAKFGYTTGINVGFNMTECVVLETGLQFSNKGYQTDDRQVVYVSPPGPNDPTQASFRYNYHYIGVPFTVKFILGKGKARFVSSAGVTANFLLNASQTAQLEYANGRTEKKRETSPENYNKIDLSPMLSVGLLYKLANNIYFTAEPTFRYGLLKTIDAPIEEHLWSAGFNLAVYHNIKRKK